MEKLDGEGLVERLITRIFIFFVSENKIEEIYYYTYEICNDQKEETYANEQRQPHVST